MQFYLAWSESLTVKVVFEQRPEGDLSVNQVDIFVESISGQRKQPSQDPEAGRCPPRMALPAPEGPPTLAPRSMSSERKNSLFCVCVFKVTVT